MSQTKPEKFLFDKHNFDDDYVPPEENEEPPPPVFSEEELETAKQESYAQGRADGLKESAESREQEIAVLLKKLEQASQTLFQAEAERNEQFEAEAVALTLTLFKTLFPALSEKYGLAEVESMLSKTLTSQKIHPEITIEVCPQDVAPVQERIATLAPDPGTCTVTESDKLSPGDCHIRWPDGGAVRDSSGLAARILQEMEEALAGKANLLDNNREQDESESAPEVDARILNPSPETDSSEADQPETDA